MNLHDLIFSNVSPTKYYRHILFWLTIYLFKSHSDTQDYNIITQLIDMVYCYVVIYWVVPQFFLSNKHIRFIAWLSAITLLVYIVRGVFYLGLYDYFAQGRDKILYEMWFHTSLFIHSGPIMRCGLFITCKMLKNYYLEIRAKEVLILETNRAELQLLKAQVQPHFLFNTLNNIYSFSLDKSPQAASLVLKLDDTIHYMNYECQAELVPLEKEIKMLQDYIGLENVRYGQRLSLKVDIKGDLENKLISPLLLIPFVENSFKHGASKMLEHPWIKIQGIAHDHSLDFQISNSKPDNVHQLNGLNGIGLANVRKRLQLLYPRDHILEINTEDDSFHVKLKLPLHSQKSESELNDTPELVLAERYAIK